MRPKVERWEDIEASYNLMPNSVRQGQTPTASRLVSELLRSQVNSATSQLVEGITGHEGAAGNDPRLRRSGPRQRYRAPD